MATKIQDFIFMVGNSFLLLFLLLFLLPSLQLVRTCVGQSFHLVLHFFIFSLKSMHIRVFGIWFNCKLLDISGVLWNEIYFLHLSVPLLKAADLANGYSWKPSSSFNAVKYLQLISMTCLHSHPT